MGVEVSRLTAPLEVHQGIVLTLPENGARPHPWEEYIERVSDATALRSFGGLDLCWGLDHTGKTGG